MASSVSACVSQTQDDGWETVGSKGKAAARAQVPVETALAALSLQSAAPTAVEERGLLGKVKNVHQDDIHGFILLPNGTFISGSKDGCLKQWDFKGKLVKDVYKARGIDYRSWITALGVFGSTHWMSGTRDKIIDLWDIRGKHLRSLDLSPTPEKSTTSKERNLERVLCLVKFRPSDEDPIFFTGWPRQFTVHNLETGEHLNNSLTHENDWVYCINPLTDRSILVVTGSKFEIWEAEAPSLKSWRRAALLLEEDARRKKRGEQRPFISSVTRLDASPAYFGLSLFNGGNPEEASIKIYDVEKQKTITTKTGHEGRAWKIENLSPHHFASCGDEGTVKIWDLRQHDAVATFVDNPKQKARVSTILKLAETIVVSGSCPDDVRRSSEKAQLCFRDLRFANAP